MKLEDEIFRKIRLEPEKLLSYGFTEEKSEYHYKENFMDDEFTAELTVDKNGQLSGRVLDRESGEEYIPVHLEEVTGSFVMQVREEYAALLERIKTECGTPQLFIHPQSNRIDRLVYETFGEKHDNPFEKYDDIAIYRNPDNRKWYGIIMNIPYNKMFPGDDERIIEVLNIKIDVTRREELLREPGIYYAYHMNHDKWVSIVLDGTVSDERIIELMAVSRELVKNHGKKANGTAWLVPANPAYYDIDRAFKKKKGVDWKQGKGIKKGDTVYMYVGAPVSAIRYKCLVTQTDIPFTFANDEVSMNALMKMDVITEYPPDYCPFAKLNELNIRAVRGPRKTNAELDRYLADFE